MKKIKKWSIKSVQDVLALTKHLKGKKIRNKTAFNFPDKEHAYLFTHIVLSLDSKNKIVEACHCRNLQVSLTFTKSALKQYLE